MSSLIKAHSEPSGQMKQNVDCRDKISGKEYCTSIWSLTLSEAQIVEVFIFSWLNLCVFLLARCFSGDKFGSNWLQLLCFRHIVTNSILQQIQIQFWPISSTCLSPVSFLCASEVELHYFPQVISHITLLRISRPPGL